MATSSGDVAPAKTDNSSGAILWSPTSFSKRVTTTAAIRDVAHLVYNLNYARRQPTWMEHVLTLPDTGVHLYVDDDGARYYYFGFPLVAREDYDHVVVRFEKDGKLEHAVHWLRKAGVDITMDHVSLLCEQTRLGFVLIDHHIKPYLYRCLIGVYNDEDDDDASDTDEETDHDLAHLLDDDVSHPVNRRGHSAKDARVRRLKRMETARKDAALCPYTISDLFASMDALLGMACLYAMLGCDTSTSSLIGNAWSILLRSASNVHGDLDDTVHARAVEEIVRKMCALHILNGRTHADLSLFDNDMRRMGGYSYVSKPRLETVMLDGLDNGKLCITIPLAMSVCLVEERIAPLVHSNPDRWEVGSAICESIWASVHTSKIMTDIAFANDGTLHRDFCARWDVDDSLATTDAPSSFAFTICANWNGEVASVKVNTWLLLCRWPWFRHLMSSGLEEARTMSVTIPTPLPPQGLFFIASLIYTPDAVEWNHVKLNAYWNDAVAACESLRIMETGLVKQPSKSPRSRRDVSMASKKKRRARSPPHASDLLGDSEDDSGRSSASD